MASAALLSSLKVSLSTRPGLENAWLLVVVRLY
jgi:hypothetical protein